MTEWASQAAVREGQILALQVLAKLLAEDLPAVQWTISDFLVVNKPLDVDGQLYREANEDETAIADLKKWAFHLGVTPTWEPNGKGGFLEAAKLIDGIAVRVWSSLSSPPKRRFPLPKKDNR